MPKLSAVAGKMFALKCPIAGYPIESVYIEKGMCHFLFIALNILIIVNTCRRSEVTH